MSRLTQRRATIATLTELQSQHKKTTKNIQQGKDICRCFPLGRRPSFDLTLETVFEGKPLELVNE